jgi:hypothetical protein
MLKMASQNFVTTIEKNHELDNELVDGMLGNFECTTLLLAFSVVLHLMLLLHRFFPLVLTKLVFIIFFTSLNIFLQEGYFLTNLEESDTKEVL